MRLVETNWFFKHDFKAPCQNFKIGLRIQQRNIYFTQNQITEILQDIANEKDGFNRIMMKSLELLISSVRKLQQEESNNYTNGYHSRKNQQNTI